ncbi:MAG TPA: hypothetical protein VFC52_01640 [Solirubrobacterales bacterium]|nr:hypothetical protein [Solirubrobacterales bacterium]
MNASGVEKTAESPQVAVDSQGNATAIWRRWSGEKLIIESAVRPVGGVWSVPATLDVDTGGGYESSQSPQVAVDPEGDATAVWERRLDGRTFVIKSATRPAGGSWSAPITISSMGRFNDWPRVVVDSEGNATAVWLWSIGESSVVQSATRPAGGIWSAPVNVSAVGRAAFFFDVALDPQGGATAVWEDESKGTIQSATRPAGGSWSAPVDLSTAGAFAHSPQVAVDPQGNATAVWERYNPKGTLIQSATRPAGGSWSAPVNLFKPKRHAQQPQIAVDPQGNATAVWARSNGDELIIQGATRPPGGSWSAPVDVSGDGGRGGEKPQLVVDPRGTATAVWRGYDRNRHTDAIQAATRPLRGRWSSPTDISNRTKTIGISEPQVAVDPLGNATVVWALGSKGGAIIQSATSVNGRAYAARVIRVKGARASIALRCERGEPCGGVIRLKVGRKLIAAKRFGIASGRTRIIRAKLSRRGFKLLTESRRPLRAKLVGRGIKNRTVLLK